MRSTIVKKRRAGLQKKPLIIVVGVAVSKKATERNILKRRVRAIMRSHLPHNKSDFTIILKKESLKIPFGELKKEITDQI